MRLFNKKEKTTLYLVTYSLDGEIFTETATSAGLASLIADYYVDIVHVVELRG